MKKWRNAVTVAVALGCLLLASPVFAEGPRVVQTASGPVVEGEAVIEGLTYSAAQLQQLLDLQLNDPAAVPEDLPLAVREILYELLRQANTEVAP